jgi:hypothetical protein
MTPSITQDQVNAILRAFILNILPAGVEVAIAQQNRVPEPTADNFVLITLLRRTRLGTTVSDWDQSPSASPVVLNNIESVSISMQLDFHGADSTDNAQVFAGLFRSSYAFQFMSASGVYPDYCDDGTQMPFINGEDQFEDRWVINAVMDANIGVQTQQQFANTIKVGLIEVDAVYPPS